MAAEEDNFDIDLYGDNNGDGATNDDYKGDEVEFTLDDANPEATKDEIITDAHEEDQSNGAAGQTQPLSSTVSPSTPQVEMPKQAPQQQGVKRKDSSSDHRPLDPGATSALLVSDLQWWNTEDDVRGWANQADAEDELKDVTFSEHKVNGKSKGQAFMEFATPQAATATKRKIDSFGTGQQNVRKCTVTYTNPSTNPFKTLPKDGPLRGKDGVNQRTTTGAYPAGNSNTNNFGNNNNMGGGFRGGRGGGFNNRGGMNNMGGGFNNNRNFSGPAGGFQQSSMGNYQNNMGGGMQGFGGFNRGGMMNNNMRGGAGMRGGRGGMNPGMMPMGNMGNMANMNNMNNMGGMSSMGMGGMNMGMGGGMNPMMNMGMPGGFQGGNTTFNPSFFPNQAVGGGMSNDGSWNPHGAKRTRQE